MRALICLRLGGALIAVATVRLTAEQVTLDYLGLELSANLKIVPGKSTKNEAVSWCTTRSATTGWSDGSASG